MEDTNIIKITIKEKQPVDYDYLVDVINALNDIFVSVEEITVNDELAFKNNEGFKDVYRYEGGES